MQARNEGRTGINTLALFSWPGLLRGIDPQKKVFYVTTPEPEEGLERVNVLGMGNSDNPEFIMTKVCMGGALI